MSYTLKFEISVIKLEKEIEKLKKLETEGNVSFKPEIEKLNKKCAVLMQEAYNKLDPWQITQIARHPKRPIFSDYCNAIFSDFIELHGDRYYADDKSIITGFCWLDNKKVMIVGHNKGKDTKENIERNFAMPKPEGYRKALRIMKLAEKFDIPIITFIDTPGAYPGMDAEERGQSEAIAKNLFEMSSLSVPIITIVIGEGGSGGALAISVADRIFMLKYSIYSVISPEGCASILWKDATKADQASKALKITANELYSLGLVDGIINEPIGGAHRYPDLTIKEVKKTISLELKALSKLPKKKLLDKRYEKFIKIGSLVRENKK